MKYIPKESVKEVYLDCDIAVGPRTAISIAIETVTN